MKMINHLEVSNKCAVLYGSLVSMMHIQKPESFFGTDSYKYCNMFFLTEIDRSSAAEENILFFYPKIVSGLSILALLQDYKRKSLITCDTLRISGSIVKVTASSTGMK